MPVWLISILLNLVLKFGIPWIVDWVKKRFNIGVDNGTVGILSDYVAEAKTDKRLARDRARRRLRERHL